MTEKHKTKNISKKGTGGITLIALVVTIIVLLILAGISISMLTGNNGILTRAGQSKEMTDTSQAVEQARIDIMAIIAEKKGENPTEKDVKDVIGRYFTSVPENLEDLAQNLTTKSGRYNVKLEDVLKGVTLKKEIKETPIAKSTEITDSYVGYYADIDNDGDVDGIIYADMVVGNTKSGRWNNDNWSDYNITKIEDVTTIKDYVVSSWTYSGQTTAGIYKANDGFGTKEVLVPATNSTGTKDRFYVMALEDFTNNSKNLFYWYFNAGGRLDRTIVTSAIDFGEGKQKTIDMINDWNNNTAKYGEQTTASSGKDSIDLWGAIQDGQYSIVSSATDSGKWFVPSKAEWSAFGEELGITTDNYVNRGLSNCYWSSSQNGTDTAYDAIFYSEYMFMRYLTVSNNSGYVRLSTTF